MARELEQFLGRGNERAFYIFTYKNAAGAVAGGFIGNLSTGVFYMMTAWFGYDQADVAGHVHDYGTKFLVAAGLLNILAMVDVFEIATGRKE